MKKLLIITLLLCWLGQSASAEPTVLLQQTFTSSQGEFTIDNVNVPSGLNVWERTSSWGMKATGYINSTRYTTESWLLSPVVDLAGYTDATITFNHLITTYFGDVSQEATVWIRTSGAEWQQMVISTYPAITSGNYSSFEDCTLSIPEEFNGKKIQIGFRYTSTTSKAGTWEIKSFSLSAEEQVIDVTPVTSLADLKSLPSGTIVELTFTKTNPGLIEYVYPTSAVRTASNQEAYVRDTHGSVQFKNFLPSDLGWHTQASGALVGKVIAQYELVNGMPRLTSIEQSKADNILCLDNRQAVSPVSISVADLAGDSWRADYVALNAVTIKKQGANYYVTDGTNMVLLANDFNQSAVSFPDRVTGIRFNLTGVVTTTADSASKLSLLSLERLSTIIDLYDYESNSTLISSLDGETIEVYLQRTLQTNQWNTIAIPFNIPNASELLGNIQLAEFSAYDATTYTLQFSTATDIVAGRPYLIKPLEDIPALIHMASVELSNTLTQVSKGTYDFVPVYDPTTLDETDTSLLFLDNTSTLKRPSGNYQLGAFQAYFKSPSADANAKITVDGVATGITLGTITETVKHSGQWYDTAGRKAPAQPAKGLYVRKGQKQIIK